MLLSCRPIADLSSVNAFRYVPTVEYTEGDAVVVYLQLTDASQERLEEGYVPAGRRYMPAVGATLALEVRSIDDAKKISRSATQPYPTQDPSIWALNVLATDKVRGTADLLITLTEGSKVTRGTVSAAFRVRAKR